ncbi:sigma-54 interaction domain-containing protein [Clostridium septicum]|uniref:sigma-54 interaction domain-containing protein n=1 Tax=Clostridium septicum TaxID=1504 RepID=UPI001FAA2DB2|nr:sigma 54-interacting transcriptional regulator [Clostridium septicum]
MSSFSDRKLLESIPLGIMSFSLLGHIEYINDIAKELLGLHDDSCSNINIIYEYPSLFKLLSNNNKDLCVYENIFIPKTNRNLSCHISPIYENCKVQGYIIVFKNINHPINLDNKFSTFQAKYTFEDIIGQSPQIKKVINECKAISKNSSAVLLNGESGSGKELLAQSIHNYSDRSNGPFIAVNCGAIPKNLIESELFGYESGSFTGAKKGGAPGKFELANGGTIFLDEIGEMPLEMQVTLLRVLQESCVTRIGGKNSIDIDVRVIAATNKDLKEEIKNCNFRSDLYYRLSVLPIKVPPLKERIGDVPVLLNHFLNIKSQKLNKSIPKISQNLFKKMISYCWPGNIRELENFVENLVALNGVTTYEIDLAECHCLTYDNLGNIIDTYSLNETPPKIPTNNITPLLALEQAEIKKAICICNGNMTKAASKLGISRNALYNKIKRYNINTNECKISYDEYK